MEYYSAIKNEIMPFAGIWRDVEIIVLNEVTQTMTNIIWCCLYVKYEKKMIQMNLFTKQKETHRHRGQIYGYQKGKGGEG